MVTQWSRPRDLSPPRPIHKSMPPEPMTPRGLAPETGVGGLAPETTEDDADDSAPSCSPSTGSDHTSGAEPTPTRLVFRGGPEAHRPPPQLSQRCAQWRG